MSKHIHLLAFVAALLLSSPWCLAQRSLGQESRRPAPAACGDSVWQQAAPAAPDSIGKVDYHMSLFSGVYSGWGETHGYMGAAPTFSYRASDRLTLKAGFAFTTDLNANSYQLCGRTPRDMAPRRSNSTGTVGVDVAAEYQVNDNLWMAAHVYYLGGSYDPIWNGGNRPQELSVYGGSVAFHYRTKRDNRLSLYFDFVHDETGALTPWMFYSPSHVTDLRGWMGY